MGVSVEGARGRRLDAVLNLVPFIDLLSVCITFLIATAVWVELSSLPVDQSLSGSPIPVAVEGPPLTVHVRHGGVWVGRLVGEGRDFTALGSAQDWERVASALADDRRAHPDEAQVTIVTDDGVPYRDMIHALDLTRAHGYSRPLLGGGPAR